MVTGKRLETTTIRNLSVVMIPLRKLESIP